MYRKYGYVIKIYSEKDKAKTLKFIIPDAV